MEYTLRIQGQKKDIHAPLQPYEGTNPEGERLEMTNYYLTVNGKPFFAASGEMHFSRIAPDRWRDEIIKLKMAGITMVSTYLFWIHHEEEKGIFRWDGCRNLREFLTICREEKMRVILRVGPFSHGECRNGGLPDWLFGTPFDVRSNDPEYLGYVRRYFAQVAEQARGMFYREGGPIISIQIENEYEHASSPWEMTTENSGEWTPSGNDGDAHFHALKAMIRELGMDAPMFTTTAWGGACYPVEDVIPLWGGYAFRPWYFYDGKMKEHPPTDEFVYRDFHNNASPMYYNFDPTYPAEDLPFVCCEMGGGMSCSYKYRFQVDWESVEAIANVKAAGGCNFLGYYMFHGGTNPEGTHLAFLNECGTPKKSYDYQAAVGEYGQIRPSYHMVKLLHYLYEDFGEIFCPTKTVLPEGADRIEPGDTSDLRWCVRTGERGSFLFVNNYQDHARMPDRAGEVFHMETDRGPVRIPEMGGLSIASGATATLPFCWKPEGCPEIRSATVQPITRLESHGGAHFIFYTPAGMEPTIAFEGDVRVEGPGEVLRTNGATVWCIPVGRTVCGTADGIPFTILGPEDRMRFWRVKRPEGDYAFLCDETVMWGEKGLRIESIGKEEGTFAVFPARETIRVNGETIRRDRTENGFSVFRIRYGSYHPAMTWENASSRDKGGDGALRRPVIGSPVTSTKTVNARAKVQFGPEDFQGVRETLIRVQYTGDIGYAFCDGKMISDNFCNGAAWEFRISDRQQELLKKGLYIYVSPIRKGGKVNSSSAMAARFETFEEAVAEVSKIETVPVFQTEIMV